METQFHNGSVNHPSYFASHGPTMSDVIAAAENSPAVVAWDDQVAGCEIEIKWVDGSADRFSDPVMAFNAIQEMSAS